MRERTLLARTAALALGAMFVLPSCFTFNLWRNGNRRTGTAVDGPMAEATPDGNGPWFLCKVEPIPGAAQVDDWHARALVRLCEQWRPPLAVGTWLEVEPLEHSELAARLWRQFPGACGLEVVRTPDNAPAPRCWFVCPANPGAPLAVLPDDVVGQPGVHARNGYFGTKVLVFEAECRVSPAGPLTAVPIDTPSASLALEVCDPPSGTAHRVLFTPLTLAVDTRAAAVQPAVHPDLVVAAAFRAGAAARILRRAT